MKLDEDRALLAAFRAGQADVLARVYETYVQDVFRLAALGFITPTVAIRPERDHEEQRAIVQDVFVRAFAERARSSYDGLRPYRPYLLTIAKNVMIDRARGRSAEAARSSEVDIDAIVVDDAPVPDLADSLEQQRLRRVAAEYIATLSDEQRSFVALRFDEDLSQLEVAARLGVSRRRVRTLERRVLTGLRKYLNKNRPETEPPR